MSSMPRGQLDHLRLAKLKPPILSPHQTSSDSSAKVSPLWYPASPHPPYLLGGSIAAEMSPSFDQLRAS